MPLFAHSRARARGARESGPRRRRFIFGFFAVLDGEVRGQLRQHGDRNRRHGLRTCSRSAFSPLRRADRGRIESACEKGARCLFLLTRGRAITRSVKARDADRQLSVQPEPTETYADNTATEFVKHWRHSAGMPSQMSQMVTIRLVCGALRHQDRRGVIGYLTDADHVPVIAHVSHAGTVQTQLRPGGWMVLLDRPSFRKL